MILHKYFVILMDVSASSVGMFLAKQNIRDIILYKVKHKLQRGFILLWSAFAKL